ncbi:MbtH family protein [Micromonospora sediminicola]|uniref:MbtH family protein n=1 Tax=Micromonospora sediminicola TaxID=946078 RepID=UPI0033F7DD9B
MTNTDVSDEWLVVVNDEEQYSIWANGRPVPAGWRAVGEPDSRDGCLRRIEELWTDMRPKSLRDRIAAASDAQ